MTCRLHRDAILDLARGEPVPHVVAQAAETHLEECRSCQAEMRRQQALTQALGTLVEDARGWTTTDDLDRRVLQSLAASQASRVGPVQQPAVIAAARVHRRRVFVFGGWGLAAAAGLVLAIALGGNARHQPEAAPRATAASPPVVPTDDATATATQAHAPTQVTSHAVRSRPAGPRRGRPPAQQTAGSFEFVEIPGAAALPAFESGAIVRLELPIAALPSYGVAIAPDARRLLVEADVLVGQDGQMRGIRLVSSEPEAAASRSRQ